MQQWETIAGSYNLYYYYNPKTYVMQWTKPVDAIVCEVRELKWTIYIASIILQYLEIWAQTLVSELYLAIAVACYS